MSTVKPPEWGAKVNDALWRMKIPKTQFAKMLGVNYTQMCNVILGHMTNPNMQKLILMKISELEERSGDSYVRP